MMTGPTIDDWYRGDPEAKRVGVERLRAVRAMPKKSLRIRMAVATLQQRWGHTPTGTLSPAEWGMLAEQAESSRSAVGDVSPEPSPVDAGDASAPGKGPDDDPS